MNARKARALRQAARRMTTGLPSHQLVRQAGTARHAATCARAVYQKLKQVYGHTNLGTLK